MKCINKAARLLLCLAVVVLAACSFSGREIKDSGPSRPVDVSHIPDAVPRPEVRTAAGNKSPYTQFGKTYWVMEDSRGFTEQGIASWYGNKFHGRQTSNGELYSMYGMTAAHKTLPIPCYVRVTNLQNGRTVVVRVNDRGPFHGDRVIDLTYAAAAKLGFVQHGTARVKLEVLEPEVVELKNPVRSQAQPDAIAVLEAEQSAPDYSAGYQLPANTFLQAGAFSTPAAAERMRQRIADLTGLPVSVSRPRRDRLYRVRIGPIADNLVMTDVRQQLQRNKLPVPHVIYD